MDLDAGELNTSQFKHTFLLVGFVKDHAGIYDSVVAQAANQGMEETLMYKLLTICGNLLNVNKGKKSAEVWLEETRSTLLKSNEKSHPVWRFDLNWFLFKLNK